MKHIDNTLKYAIVTFPGLRKTDFFGMIERFMTHKLQSALVAASLLMPQIALAMSVKTSDTIAGLGTDIVLQEAADATEVMVYPPFGEGISLPYSERVRVPGDMTDIAGVYDVEVRSGTTILEEANFTVLPGSVDLFESTVQAAQTSLSPNGVDRTIVEVVLRDSLGNVLPGRPVELICSRSEDSITPLQTETDTYGTQEFAISTTLPGEIALRAVDLMSGKVIENNLVLNKEQSRFAIGGYENNVSAVSASSLFGPAAVQSTRNNTFYGTASVSGQSAYRPSPSPNPSPNPNALLGLLLQQALLGQLNTFDVIDGYSIDVPEDVNVNQDVTIRIRAIDRSGNRVEDYTGMVLLASTDPTALLPLNGQVQFVPQNLGEKTLTLGLRFRTAGQHILHLEDSTDPNVSTQITVNVIGDGTPFDPTIDVSSHADGAVISDRSLTLEGQGPGFVNLFVTGGQNDVTTETDRDGNFSVGLALSPTQSTYTIRVRDESGRFDSGDIHLSYDGDAPEIGMFTFEPSAPESQDVVTLTLESEPQLSELRVAIDDKEYTAIESTTGSGGVYTVQFEAPDMGAYQPVITAVDAAGNTTEVRGNLVVAAQSLPQVQGVIVEAKAESASLTWDPIEDERTDAYRIYVGESPDNFLYTLDTDRATPAATVAGLDPGTTYYFAVTALQGDRESIEKSEVVSMEIEGIGLSVSAQDSALLLEWEHATDNGGLSSYIVEYGVEEGVFTEKRILSGELQAMTLRNLLNDVTYFVRITPVTTTGDVLAELATDGSGTPVGTGGFQPSQGDPVPDSLITHNAAHTPPPLASNIHAGAPSVPSTGIPIPVWIFAVAVSAVVFIRYRYQRKLQQVQHASNRLSMTDIRVD